MQRLGIFQPLKDIIDIIPNSTPWFIQAPIQNWKCWGGGTCTSMFGYVINVYMCIHIQIKQNISRQLLLSNFFCIFFVCLSYYRYSFLVLKIQRGGAAIPVTFLLDQPMFHNVHVIENKCMSIKKVSKTLNSCNMHPLSWLGNRKGFSDKKQPGLL